MKTTFSYFPEMFKILRQQKLFKKKQIQKLYASLIVLIQWMRINLIMRTNF